MQFLPEDFDPWAEHYDSEVAAESGFPFLGYSAVMKAIIEQANPQPGLKVLDVGCGTGNLSVAYVRHGCQVWGTDFSEQMIAKARQKSSEVQFAVADLREPLPDDFPPFDLIVSAYVFHHFPIEEKIKLLERYKNKYLNKNGKIVIGDIMFPSQSDRKAVAQQYADSWDDEYYWILDQDLPLIEAAGLEVKAKQISVCAGIVWFEL
ncbi:MAG TPA: class I SAM-dependent methyltransferase [Anaerolineaceae bacterium]|nr:class I SAM-dependent methyltransferase [Anaerolineaceae bacterium]